ncbi:MAG: NAD-dependent epimerase/dehydratase family protein [Patescibacteria group bacterium]
MIENYYLNKNVLVLGGTGFIGSNLTLALLNKGAKVTILSRNNLPPKYIPINNPKLKIIKGDIRDVGIMQKVILNKDIVFNLAAQISHLDKGIVSYDDLDINCRGQLVLLETCRTHNTSVKIVFASTRMVYGNSSKKKLTESHPTEPNTLYGIHKLTAERYHLLYRKRHNINVAILRIANPYGERQDTGRGLYSLPGWFMHKALKNELIEIWGKGNQLRDYIYIDDLISALLIVAKSPKSSGEIYNCGSGRVHKFKEMAKYIVKTAKSGRIKQKPWPNGYPNIQNDSYGLDISKLRKLGWKPQTTIMEGIRKTFNFYNED